MTKADVLSYFDSLNPNQGRLLIRELKKLNSEKSKKAAASREKFESETRKKIRKALASNFLKKTINDFDDDVAYKDMPFRFKVYVNSKTVTISAYQARMFANESCFLSKRKVSLSNLELLPKLFAKSFVSACEEIYREYKATEVIES